MRAEYLVAGLLAGVLLLAAAPPPAQSHEPTRRPPQFPTGGLSPHPSLAVVKAAADFALLDLDEHMVRLVDFRGRIVLLSFIYTSCPSACPLNTQRMAVLQRRLREAGLFPSRVNLLSVTVDPERDTPAVLSRYANSFAADASGWWFLRDEPERLGPVLAAWDEWTRAVATGEIDHPARMYLIDQRGRIREIYSRSFFHEGQAFLDIQALLRDAK